MYSFVKNRSYAYIIALILGICSVLTPFILPVNQGIDLTGWVQAKYSLTHQEENLTSVIESTKNTIIPKVYQELSDQHKAIIGDAVVYGISGTRDFMVEVGINESLASGDTQTKTQMINDAKTHFFELLEKYTNQDWQKISQSQYVNIGASVGAYIKNSGYMALALVGIMISFYIMYAFSGAIPGIPSWPFAVVTAVCLLHDVVISFGLYALVSVFFPEFKLDIFVLTALLTVLGYSINDTIVILDKVRATLHSDKKNTLSIIIDNAIHSTMRRSLFTSLTVLVVLIAMFVWWPEAIRGFVLVLMFGTIIGTGSSVFLAAPALVDLVNYDPSKPLPKKEEKNPDGIYL